MYATVVLLRMFLFSHYEISTRPTTVPRTFSTSFAACQYWLLAELFCYLHHLPLSKAFLTECAKENDWVMFITYAQLHQYPKERVSYHRGVSVHSVWKFTTYNAAMLTNLVQVAEVVGSFSASHLSEHLLYVVENVSVDMNLEKSPDISPTRSGRDVRAQLYSRIGVAKRKGQGRSQHPNKLATV